MEDCSFFAHAETTIAASATKKPTWQNTQRYSATSVYFLTSSLGSLGCPRVAQVALYLVIRKSLAVSQCLDVATRRHSQSYVAPEAVQWQDWSDVHICRYFGQISNGYNSSCRRVGAC